MANNDTANVSVTKGVQGGYFFSAPAGTTPPADYSTQLGSEFSNLGFISEDGISESIESNSDSMVDMNGDTIATASSSREETVSCTLVEIKKDSLSEIYGHSNVTESDDGKTITVKHKGGDRDARVYVFELLLKDGRKWRQVIPNGQVTEVGDLALASGDLAGRQVTITANVDTSGVSVYDYIQVNKES